MDINVGTRCEPFCEGNYGSETLRERMGMDKKLTVTDGDGQNFHYRAALYSKSQCRVMSANV